MDVDRYPFARPEQAKEFNELLERFRCQVCENQSVSDSFAATELKDKVYWALQQGHSKKEIVAMIRQEYGDAVSYAPPLKATTAFLWFGPVIVAISALIWFSRQVKN